MATFLWYGENSQSIKCQGIKRAENRKVLVAYLSEQGIQMQQAYYLFLPKLWRGVIHKRYLSEVLIQWANMLAAGIPLSDAVRMGLPNKPDIKTRWQLCALWLALHKGCQLSEALTLLKLMQPSNILLLQAGEQSGCLDHVMYQLANQQLRIKKLHKALYKSLFMPGLTLLIGILVSMALLVWLVPNIELLVVNSKQAVPAATQFLLDASYVLNNYGRWLAGIAVSIAGLLWVACKNARVARMLRALFCLLPIVARLYRQQAYVRLFQLLDNTHKGGMPIIQALDIFLSCCPNKQVYRQVEIVKQHLLQGVSLSRAFALASFAETYSVSIAIGEKTGDIQSAYSYLSRDTEKTLHNSYQLLQQLIEPSITLFLAGLVGGMVIAVYLPLLQMGSLIG